MQLIPNMKKFVSQLLSVATIVGVLAALNFALRSSASAESTNPAAMAGKPAPTWELKKLDGTVLKSADLAGKVVIVDFWATWCPPCRAEIPGFVTLQKKYADKGVVFVGMSVDQGGVGVVKKFAEANHMNYPIVLADEGVVNAFGGIEAIPSTFVINRKGEIVKMFVGYDSPEKFESVIQPLL